MSGKTNKKVERTVTKLQHCNFVTDNGRPNNRKRKKEIIFTI